MLANFPDVRLDLTTPFRQVLLLAVVLVAAAALVFAAGFRWRADRLAQSSRLEDWQRAVKLEPNNADRWYRLGWYLQYRLDDPDLDAAIGHYQHALTIQPRSDVYWLELGTAYEAAGQTDQAGQAFAQAKQVYPISSDVAWKYGNFLIRQGDFERGFPEIRRAVKTDPKLARQAVAVCWRASGDAHRLLLEALPAESHAYLAALGYFLAEQQTDPALVAWERLVSVREGFALQRALPLVEALAQLERYSEALRVWRQSLALAGMDPQNTSESLIWNGSFDKELVNGGFGWRAPPVKGAQAEWDSAVFRSAPASLRIRFDGTTNVDFQHVFQLVPVEPNRRYRFEAYLRTEGITTDSGVQVWIYDPRHANETYALTPDIVGTQPWSLEEAQITTKPQTRLLAIAVRRRSTSRFDNKVRGLVWMDDVSLTPLGPALRTAP